MDGTAKLPRQELETLLDGLRADLQAHVAALGNMADAQRARQLRAGNKTGGRPVTTWYAVSLGSLWTRVVLGAPRAIAVLETTLAKHKGGKAPTRNSLSVQLSQKGEWSRLLATDDGDHALTVRKCSAPSAEDAEALEAQWRASPEAEKVA